MNKNPFDPKDPRNLDDREEWLGMVGMKPDHPWFFVVSTYGQFPGRRKCLVQVHSRRMSTRQDAETWMHCVEAEHLKKNKGKAKGKHFSILEVPHYQWRLFV
jgi:hypothetical protein